MQDEQGFDDNQKLQLIDFNYKPLGIHQQLKRRASSKTPNQEWWQLARDINSGELTRAVLQKQPQNVVFSSFLRQTTIQDVHIQFQASSQSSNLQLVIRRRFMEFQLFIKPDTNTSAYQQWFYFSVKSVKGHKKAAFTLKNLAKSGMLYNQGLKPYFKRKKQTLYEQLPDNVKYYQNPGEQSFSLRFQFQFLQEGEEVQFCSQPPYTYSKLLDYLQQKKLQWKSLCKTQLGKKVPYLVFNEHKNPKAYVIVLARQHPGESVGSWMMQGVLEKLISASYPGIQWLVFPMFNVDGVIVGNNRTGLAGFDFNRFWNTQELSRREKYFPEIIGFINMVRFLKRLHPRKPKMVFDLHGHSSQPNIFAYGPPIQPSSQHFQISRAFPELLSRKNYNFNIQQCSYTIKQDKKSTARSYLYHQLTLPFVYTIEASFGIMRGKTVNEKEYLKFGMDLVDSTHQFINSCVFGQKSIEAVKARGQHQQADQIDSDNQKEAPSIKKSQNTGRYMKNQKARMVTQVCQAKSHKESQENHFQLFKIEENVHSRFQQSLDKTRNLTQVGLSTSKKRGHLPKLKQSHQSKSRANSAIKEQQLRAGQLSLMNIRQVQKRVFRLRNNRIGKKILIINAYGI